MSRLLPPLLLLRRAPPAAAAAASSFPNPGHTQSGGPAAPSAPAARPRWPPARRRPARGLLGSLKVRAPRRRGAPLAREGRGGPGGLQLQARARRPGLGGVPLLALAARVRLVRSLPRVFFSSPLFFFFRSAELMLVNKSSAPAAPLPPPLPHTGARRARARQPHTLRARAHWSGHSRSPGARRAPGPGRRAPRAGAQERRDVRSGARRGRLAARRRPQAPPCACTGFARAPLRSPPPHCAGQPARARPSRKTPKTMPPARALPGRGAGWGAGRGLGRAGRGARGPGEVH